MTISRGSTPLNVSHGLLVVPDGGPDGSGVDVAIGVDRLFTTPLYWSLPATFLGDKILSYNGYLRFTTTSNGRQAFASDAAVVYPLVQLQGNYRVILEHYPLKLSASGRYEVR